ncbi:MAG: hypothetical protein Q8Q09_01215 [Deltaproteobacteria bacterium]|nr:hypothetical protein [Deltaproteobacteria bacterium]
MSDRRVREKIEEDQALASLLAPKTTSAVVPYRDASHVGRPTTAHRMDSAEQRGRRLWGLGSAVISLGSFASIPFALTESNFTAGIATVLGLGFAGLASMALRAYARERGAAVATFDHGLALRVADERLDIAWESIAVVKADMQTDRAGVIRAASLTSLVLEGGREVPIPRALEDATSLAQQVFARTQTHLLAQAHAALDRGSSVSFGSILWTPKGVSVSGVVLPTHARLALVFEGPFAHLVAVDEPAHALSVLIETLHNPHVLLALIANPWRPSAEPLPAPSAGETEAPDEPAPSA